MLGFRASAPSPQPFDLSRCRLHPFWEFFHSLMILLQTSHSTPGFSSVLSSALAFLIHSLPYTSLNSRGSKLSPLLIFRVFSFLFFLMALWGTSAQGLRPSDLHHTNALDPFIQSHNKCIPLFCACFLLPTQDPFLSLNSKCPSFSVLRGDPFGNNTCLYPAHKDFFFICGLLFANQLWMTGNLGEGRD